MNIVPTMAGQWKCAGIYSCTTALLRSRQKERKTGFYFEFLTFSEAYCIALVWLQAITSFPTALHGWSIAQCCCFCCLIYDSGEVKTCLSQFRASKNLHFFIFSGMRKLHQRWKKHFSIKSIRTSTIEVSPFHKISHAIWATMHVVHACVCYVSGATWLE